MLCRLCEIRTCQRYANAVLRLLRLRFARPATRGTDRCRREHVARCNAPQVLLPVRRFRARRICESETRDTPARVASCLPRHQGHGTARQRESQLATQGGHRRAYALHRRLGCGDHRQEPGDDFVRIAGLGYQSQSEIRFREEGPAYHLLSIHRTRAHPYQLRIRARGRRDVARSSSIPAHQCLGRTERRWCVHHPE